MYVVEDVVVCVLYGGVLCIVAAVGATVDDGESCIVVMDDGISCSMVVLSWLRMMERCVMRLWTSGHCVVRLIEIWDAVAVDGEAL